MALTFTKIEPVGFGDLKVMPKMTAETKLRVSQLKITATNLEEARETLALAFPENAEEVKNFMRDNFSSMDYTLLQVYLTQGHKGVEDMARRLDAIFLDEAKKAIAEDANNG